MEPFREKLGLDVVMRMVAYVEISDLIRRDLNLWIHSVLLCDDSPVL